jgi:NAD(P)-dependent dehydrogenase (short-subunit alcohol dehydrogenase family)
MAIRLLEEGAEVWMVDRDELVLEAAKSFGANSALVDVSEPGAIDAVVAEVEGETGKLDIFIANAGIGGGAPVVDLSDDLYRRIMSINLDSVFYSCRAAARVMKEAGSGSIITVSSVFGRDTPAGSAAYGAAKAGVIALTHALARELAANGVRVNCISPGHMGTDLYWTALRRRAAASSRTYDETVAAELAQVPMGRFGNGEDAGALAAFLCSDDAAYITGQTINVDGGLQPM